MIISSKGWATTKHSSGTVDHISICTHACSVQCVANLHMQIYHTPVSASCPFTTHPRDMGSNYGEDQALKWPVYTFWYNRIRCLISKIVWLSINIYSLCFSKNSGLFRCHYISIRIYFYVYLFCLFFFYTQETSLGLIYSTLYSANSGLKSERRGATKGWSWQRNVMAHIKNIMANVKITVLLQTLYDKTKQKNSC